MPAPVMRPPRPLRPGEPIPPDFSCQSIEVASPDNQCSVALRGGTGTIPALISGSDTALVMDSLTVTLSCSTERGGFGRSILVTNSARHRVGVRWDDAHRLTVGIPVDARFAPPVEEVDNFGERIDIAYVPLGTVRQAQPPPVLDCLERRVETPQLPHE